MKITFDDLKYKTGMKFDLNKMLPFDSVYPLVLFYSDLPDHLRLCGTGFIVKFGKMRELFFVTAEHCFNKERSNQYMKIMYKPNNLKLVKKLNIGQKLPCYNEAYDVAVFHIPKKSNKVYYKYLQKIAIPLYANDQNMDDVLSEEGELRVVGYPLAYETPKDAYKSRIEYQDQDIVAYQDQDIVAYHRFFKGKAEKSEDHNIYKLTNIDWESEELSGFSGSPVVGFSYKQGKELEYNFLGNMNKDAYFDAITDNKDIDMVVLGMVITGGKDSHIVRFVSIDVIVNIIKNYLNGLNIFSSTNLLGNADNVE